MQHSCKTRRKSRSKHQKTTCLLWKGEIRTGKGSFCFVCKSELASFSIDSPSFVLTCLKPGKEGLSLETRVGKTLCSPCRWLVRYLACLWEEGSWFLGILLSLSLCRLPLHLFVAGCCMAQRFLRCPGGRPSVSATKRWRCRKSTGYELKQQRKLEQTKN